MIVRIINYQYITRVTYKCCFLQFITITSLLRQTYNLFVNRCNGLAVCTLNMVEMKINDMTDPCPGFTNYFEVFYRCVNGENILAFIHLYYYKTLGLCGDVCSEKTRKPPDEMRLRLAHSQFRYLKVNCRNLIFDRRLNVKLH